MPDLTASVVMGVVGAPFDAGARSRKAKKEIAGTNSASVLPASAGKKKSGAIGRYQFCKDGVGWRCREIVGRGANRKRPYLGYLSRAAYERMQMEAPTRKELEEKLIEWADKKREGKLQQGLPFQPEAEHFQRRRKRLVIPESLSDTESRK